MVKTKLMSIGDLRNYELVVLFVKEWFNEIPKMAWYYIVKSIGDYINYHLIVILLLNKSIYLESLS